MLLLFSGMYNSLINVGVFMKRLFTILLLLSAVCFAGQYVLAGDPPPTGSGTGSSGTGSGSGNGGSKADPVQCFNGPICGMVNHICIP